MAPIDPLSTISAGLGSQTDIDPNDDYAALQSKLKSKELTQKQDYYDLLKSTLAKNDTVSPGQAFAASALALIPILAGKYWGGNADAAIGAQAGNAATGGYLKGIQADNEKETTLSKLLAAQKYDELKATQGEQRQIGLKAVEANELNKTLSPGGAKYEFEMGKIGAQKANQKELIDYKRDYGGQPGDDRAVPENVIQDLAYKTRTDPEIVRGYVKSQKDLRNFSNILYATGSNVRTPSEKLQEQITDHENLSFEIADIKSKLAKIDSNGLIDNLKRDINAISGDTIEGQVARKLKLLAFTVARASQGGNSISNKDIALYSDIISGNVLTSTDGIRTLLDNIDKQSNNWLAIRKKTAEGSRINMGGLNGQPTATPTPTSSGGIDESSPKFQQYLQEELAKLKAPNG